MSSPIASLPPGEPGEQTPDNTTASPPRLLEHSPDAETGHGTAPSPPEPTPDEGTSASRVALGNILQDPDAATDAGPEVHLTGRAALGAVGEVIVELPPRFEDPDGQPRATGELELDGASFFVIHTQEPLERPTRLKLRRRGLPGPTGARGDIVLDVRPDESLPVRRAPQGPPATAVTFAVVAVGTLLVLVAAALRFCGG